MSGRQNNRKNENKPNANRRPAATSRFGSQSSTTGAPASARSSSAFPAFTQAMRDLSVNEASASTREPRSYSVHQRTSRRALCSAVPNSAVLAPVHRPDQGGRKGDEIEVYANHFRVKIDETATVYQYDVDIVMIHRSGKAHASRKDERREVMQAIVRERKDLPTIWYDEGKTLYTRTILPEVKLPLQVKLGKGTEMKTFCLTKMDLVRQERIQSIADFIQRRTTVRPQEAIRIVETLFKQRAQNELLCIRNQFYDRNRQLEDMEDGRGLAKGFYQALFLTRSGPTLNINLTFTCFYKPMGFLDFASEFLRKDITKGVNQRDLDGLARIIRNLQIETMHTGHRRFYRFRQFGRPAKEQTFPRGDNDEEGAGAGEPITVANYFTEKYRRLLHPELPCINGTVGTQTKSNWLPMETVWIVEWQRAVRPLDKTQRGQVSKNTILRPDQRYAEIMKIVRSNNFDRDRYLKELSIHVADKEMLKLKARVIPPPEITYRRGRNQVVEAIQGGQWRIRNWFAETKTINSWGIIYFGDRPDRQITAVLQDFQQQFPELLRRTGFVINGQLSLEIKGAAEGEIMESLDNASRQRWQLAIVVLNSFDSAKTYESVKRYANRSIGLMTQCVNYRALEKNIGKLFMYAENISQKINGKLGGVNGVVNVKSALSRSSREDLFMFFGADVTHSTCSNDHPSIAAVVGSRDTTNSLYAARISEQYPKKGRCSMEIIKDLDTMVAQLLEVFAKGHGNRLPNKIVFYRDGVDEGQYQKVLDNEVTKIKDACSAVYGDRSLPQLTFIVVKKRHNTRFFRYENNQTLNLHPGTVIDQEITHPFQFDFYLCSQNAIKGTARPALYHVLHDDNHFSSDDVQQLTYWLCHTDMRCTKSVSIPAPVHYAHLAAYAARALRLGKDDETASEDGDNEDPEEYSLEDIKTEVMMLDSKVADDMWFL